MSKPHTLRLSPYVPHKPFAKQAAFLLYDGLEALYGGAAGPGKTDALLAAALQYVDVSSYAALILRRSYTDLALPGAIMDRAHEWLEPWRKKGIHWNRETHTFTFPSGANLAFGYISTARDRYRYQSAEFQYIGFDEVCEFPEEEDYTFLFSRLRRLEGVDVPLRMRCASNPVGPGTYWVRRRFVDEPTPDRLFLPATFWDNPHIDHEAYLKSLSNLHPSLQERLISGSWDAIEDSAFPEFDEDTHVIDPISRPRDWRSWEAMDFGITNPTAWLAASLTPPHSEDGDPDTIVHGEYYKPGLIADHASAILTNRSLYWGEPSLAVCDPSIRARTGFGQQGVDDTVHSEFSRHGIYLLPANNDRRAGRVRIAQLLRPDPNRVFPEWHPRAGSLGAPRIYFTRNCKELISQVWQAPLDPVEGETVDPYWETRHGHAMAALRYLVTARIYPGEVSKPPQGGSRGLGWSDWSDWRSNEWREVG